MIPLRLTGRGIIPRCNRLVTPNMEITVDLSTLKAIVSNPRTDANAIKAFYKDPMTNETIEVTKRNYIKLHDEHMTKAQKAKVLSMKDPALIFPNSKPVIPPAPPVVIQDEVKVEEITQIEVISTPVNEENRDDMVVDEPEPLVMAPIFKESDPEDEDVEEDNVSETVNENPKPIEPKPQYNNNNQYRHNNHNRK